MWSLLWWCLQSALTSLRQWDARIFRIWESAVKLLPVPLRTDGVKQPTPAQSLVDYKTSEVTTLDSIVCVLPWVVAGFFFKEWALRGSEWRKSPAKSRGSFQVGTRGQAPRSWRHFLKTMHKYFIYWCFGQHLQQKNTRFNIFRGKCPPCPCLWAPIRAAMLKWENQRGVVHFRTLVTLTLTLTLTLT